jgi:hypothetical protein
LQRPSPYGCSDLHGFFVDWFLSVTNPSITNINKTEACVAHDGTSVLLTPLQFAALSTDIRSSAWICRLLLQYGADITLISEEDFERVDVIAQSVPLVWPGLSCGDVLREAARRYKRAAEEEEEWRPRNAHKHPRLTRAAIRTLVMLAKIKNSRARIVI